MSRSRRAVALPTAGLATAAVLALACLPQSQAVGPYSIRKVAPVGAYETEAVGETLFFVRARYQPQIWKSDGTVAGTVLLKDMSTPGGHYSRINDLTAVGDTLFFHGEDGTLWKSDGTDAGTVRVADVGAEELTDVDGSLFFSAGSGGSQALWTSDGTEEGTVPLKTFDSEPKGLTAVGDTVFFTADDGEHGEELWSSDGTTEGTVLVKDITPGGESYFCHGSPYSYDYYCASFAPAELTSVGGSLFFTQNAGSGPRLFTSDGTDAGTTMIDDLPARGLIDVAGTLYFTSDNGRELWRSDGSADGTVLVSEFASDAGNPAPRDLTVVGDQLFFTLDDGVHGRELWTSDGTDSGTRMVQDLQPADPEPDAEGPGDLTAVDGTLFFTVDDGSHGQEVWVSDGTRAGTILVEDVVPGPEGSDPRALVDVDGRLFFSTGFVRADRALWTLGDPPTCAGTAATIKGSGLVVGTPGDDVILGGAGADRIRGRGGDDTICGRGGPDSIVGGSGSDGVHGDRGRDYLDLRDGVRRNDRGDGGPGRDAARADRGDILIDLVRSD